MGSSTVVRCSYFNVSRDNLMNYKTYQLLIHLRMKSVTMYTSAVTCMASTCAPSPVVNLEGGTSILGHL